MRNKIRAAGKFLSVFESRVARDVGVLSLSLFLSLGPFLFLSRPISSRHRYELTTAPRNEEL